MSSETRQCQNCKQLFRIEPEDFMFYEKIKVPPPTWCPECRLIRRLLWRNERALYHRTCDLCGKSIIARYHPDLPFPVYCVPCWYSDNWDPLDYGQAYDFSKPFFAQWRELSQRAPHPALFQKNVVNAEYCNQCLNVKNVYLSASIIHSEDIIYSYRVDYSRDSMDCTYAQKVEQCYGAIDTAGSANIQFSRYVRNCLDGAFLYDVRGSSNCFGCVNRRNAKFQIWNQSYSPEEFQTERRKYDLGSYQIFQEVQEKFEALVVSYPRRYAMLEKTDRVVGDNVLNGKNCLMCFDGYNLEDCKYIFSAADGLKDCYDVNNSGLHSELCYEGWSNVGSRNRFSMIAQGQDATYSEFIIHSNASNLFGCSCIPSQKEFCILNKQYTREEYETLAPRIAAHMDVMPYMDAKGRVYRYGEFFPPEFSPFGYNEIIAQDLFPLTKEQALKQGYRWRDVEEKHYSITCNAEELPDHIRDAPDSILQEVIDCLHNGVCNEQCTRAFKIIPQELHFYRAKNITLPRLCPNCRHYQRMKQRNPLKLWHRRCTCGGVKSDNSIYTNQTQHFHKDQPCPNEFETSYAPERPEIVYCEACYQSEVI